MRLDGRLDDGMVGRSPIFIVRMGLFWKYPANEYFCPPFALSAAGVDAIAVCYGAHSESSLRALQPRACLASVADLAQWLQRHA